MSDNLDVYFIGFIFLGQLFALKGLTRPNFQKTEFSKGQIIRLAKKLINPKIHWTKNKVFCGHICSFREQLCPLNVRQGICTPYFQKVYQPGFWIIWPFEFSIEIQLLFFQSLAFWFQPLQLKPSQLRPLKALILG